MLGVGEARRPHLCSESINVAYRGDTSEGLTRRRQRLPQVNHWRQLLPPLLCW